MFESLMGIRPEPQKQVTSKEVTTSGFLPDPVTVVWVHFREGGNRDQLRYSVRSFRQWLTGVHNYVVCGDVPWWYCGDIINQPQITSKKCLQRYGSDLFQKYTDSIVKLQAIIDSPLVTEEFLWMYDDTYLLGQLSVEQVAVPRPMNTLRQTAFRNGESIRKGWKGLMTRTSEMLLERGLPDWNYSTHYPVVYQKEKLKEVISEFDLPRNSALIESLYLNYVNPDITEPESISGWFRYTRSPNENWTPITVMENVGLFNAAVQPQMRSRFGAKCDLERTAEMDQYRYQRNR